MEIVKTTGNEANKKQNKTKPKKKTTNKQDSYFDGYVVFNVLL